MNWPTHSDYQDAIQNPSICFQEPELKFGEPRLDMLGLPRVMSGNFASVYELKCGDKRWAIRCFVRQVPGQQGRYARLSQYLQNVTLPYLVRFDYMLKGILVRGEWYPIVKMQWVDGLPLNTWIEENLKDSQALLKLAGDWRTMMKDLVASKLAHGDLQHGNVMVTPDNKLRLVDYDGMFAPVFGRGRAPELGHANFQHPRRTSEFYQEELDNFSALVIYSSLRALATDPDLWTHHYTMDNLVLSACDFKNPRNSLVFGRFKQNSDPAVVALGQLIEKCCLSPVQNVPDFNQAMEALDQGLLKDLPMKMPAPVQPLSLGKASQEASAAKAQKPAMPESRPGTDSTRSAYDHVSTVATQPLKSKPSPAMPSLPVRPAPVIEKAPDGIPGWVWGTSGAVLAAVIVLVMFSLKERVSHDVPESEPVAEANPSVELSAPPVEVVAQSMPSISLVDSQPDPTPQPAPRHSTGLIITTLGALKGHSGAVEAMAFSPDGKLLASAAGDRCVRIWDIRTGQPKRTLNGATESFVSIGFMPDRVTVRAVTADNVVWLWDYNTGQLQRKIELYKDSLFPVTFSRDGQTLAAGLAADRKTVQLLDPFLGSVKRSFLTHRSWVKCVGFSQDAQLLVSVCHDESVSLWDAASGRLIRNFESAGVADGMPTLSRDNQFLASGNGLQEIKIWDVDSGALRQSLAGHTDQVRACAFSPDGRWLVTGSADHSIKVWDVVTGAEKLTLTGHSGEVTTLGFSSDGTMLISGSTDSSLRLWDVRR